MTINQVNLVNNFSNNKKIIPNTSSNSEILIDGKLTTVGSDVTYESYCVLIEEEMDSHYVYNVSLRLNLTYAYESNQTEHLVGISYIWQYGMSIFNYFTIYNFSISNGDEFHLAFNYNFTTEIPIENFKLSLNYDIASTHVSFYRNLNKNSFLNPYLEVENLNFFTYNVTFMTDDSEILLQNYVIWPNTSKGIVFGRCYIYPIDIALNDPILNQIQFNLPVRVTEYEKDFSSGHGLGVSIPLNISYMNSTSINWDNNILRTFPDIEFYYGTIEEGNIYLDIGLDIIGINNTRNMGHFQFKFIQKSKSDKNSSFLIMIIGSFALISIGIFLKYRKIKVNKKK